MKDDLLCRQCDTANPAGATFCIACSASLVAPATGATQRIAAPAGTAPVRRCRACGGANPSEALYCVGCGAALGGAPARGAALAPVFAGGAATTMAVQPVYLQVRMAAELPLVVRALWFFFIGLPLGLAWVLMAWFFNLTLIGLPLGLWMLTMMPQVMTLKQSTPVVGRSASQGAAGFAVRAVYFAAIGWWLSLLWMLLAWTMAATVIGLPLAFLMFERTGAVLTLADG